MFPNESLVIANRLAAAKNTLSEVELSLAILVLLPQRKSAVGASGDSGGGPVGARCVLRLAHPIARTDYTFS